MNTDITKLNAYEVIVVRVKTGDYGHMLEDRVAEVNAYIYGRSFLLDSLPVEPSKGQTYDEFDLYYLVERRYSEQVISRLASGLLWARHSIRPERQRVVPEYPDQKEA